MDTLAVMRIKRDRLVAESEILSRQIRIAELKEQIARLEADMEAQRKVIEKADADLRKEGHA